MDIKTEMEQNGYIRYEAVIRRNNNSLSQRIKMPANIGKPGDVVEVYVKRIRTMVDV